MERDTPFETPWASNQPLNPRMCPPWWPGRHTTKIPRHSAQYSPDAETRTTHRPTSHGPLPLLFVSDLRRPRTMISDTAVARSARNCAKKRRSHVFFLCDVLKSRGGGKTTSSSQHQVSRLAAGAADARLLRPARAGEGSLSTLTSE